jgi:hypothetical protein
MSIRQAELLTFDNVALVFGADTVESWNINWEMINASSYENPKKSRVLSKIVGLLTSQGRNMSQEANDLFLDLCQIKKYLIDVSLNQLIERTNEYFSGLHPHAIFDIALKKNGKQLEVVVTVKLESGEIIKYYVKTHSDGLLSEEKKSSASRIVSVEEIFVYKILES